MVHVVSMWRADACQGHKPRCTASWRHIPSEMSYIRKWCCSTSPEELGREWLQQQHCGELANQSSTIPAGYNHLTAKHKESNTQLYLVSRINHCCRPDFFRMKIKQVLSRAVTSAAWTGIRSQGRTQMYNITCYVLV